MALLPISLPPTLFRGLAALSLLLAAAAAPPAQANGTMRPAAASAAASDIATYGARDDVIRFGAELVARHGLDPDWVRSALREARYVPAAAKFIMPAPPGTAKNWAAYRARMVEPTRIQAGVEFWDNNAAWLERAQQRFGVPPEIIIGILGVETIYGQQMGSYRVIDTLATLAFDFPAGRSDRSAYFRSELENYLVLCKREGIDPLEWRGSYAGAIGMPQFMPSSILRDAIDFDGDGHVDLHTSRGDVIASIANFLAKAGWQPGLVTHFDVAVPVETRDRAALLGPDILPLFSPEEFVEHGALLPDPAMAIESKLALVELQNGDAATSYVAGTTNFYTITRYNRSSYYAMAVIELGQAVKRTRAALAAAAAAAAAARAPLSETAVPETAVPVTAPEQTSTQ